MPKISIIVTMHNAEEYLVDCLDSILNQTYQDFELILVNCASTDKTINIAKECCTVHPNVKLLQRGKDFFADAKNQALQFTKGSYVLFVDAMDTLHPELLERMMERMEKDHAEIAIIPISPAENEAYEAALGDNKWILSKKDAMKCLLSRNIKSKLSSKLIKRSLFNSTKFISGKYLEDMGIMHFLFDDASVITYDNFPGYFSNSEYKKSSATNFEKLIQCAELLMDRYEFAAEYYPEFKEIALDVAVSSALSTSMEILDKNPENWRELMKTMREILTAKATDIEQNTLISKTEKKTVKNIIDDNLAMCYIYAKTLHNYKGTK